jgi:hypothetical protein
MPRPVKVLARGVTIATRYCAVRRQFQDRDADPHAGETQVPHPGHSTKYKRWHSRLRILVRLFVDLAEAGQHVDTV